MPEEELEIKNYAVVGDDNIVQNVVAWNGVSNYNPGAGLRLIQSDTAGKGHIYDPATQAFTNPAHDAGESEDAGGV